MLHKKRKNKNKVEDKVIKCCKDIVDKGIWFPHLNDCREALDDCLRDAGLINPGAPSGESMPSYTLTMHQGGFSLSPLLAHRE